MCLYPGAGLRRPLPDWSDYAELTFDITLDDGTPLDVIVKIEDAQHNHGYYDRFHRTLRVSPGTHRIRISLADVEESPRDSKLDLRRVTLVQFFSVELQTSRVLFLDNLAMK